MRKLLAGIGLLMLWAGISHAGTPMENLYMGQSNLSNTTIIGSTSAAQSNGNLTFTLTPPTVNSGGGSFSCRECFTKFVIQIPTTTVVSILDAATTDYTIYGLGLGTSGVNTLVLSEDHLGPFCIGTGDKFMVNLVNTTGAIQTPQSFNYEGYTQCGGTLNAGPMQ